MVDIWDCLDKLSCDRRYDLIRENEKHCIVFSVSISMEGSNLTVRNCDQLLLFRE